LANRAYHRLGGYARSCYNRDGVGAAAELSGARNAVVRGPLWRIKAIVGRILSSAALGAKILPARRDRLVAMRSDGVIGDEAFHRLEEELDFADLALTTRM
jgi:hypothetical protein